MKRGDIVLNKFGGVPENRILVYIGNGNFIYLYDNEFCKGRWNMKDKYHDGTPNLEVIGHSNAFKILKKDILEYQKAQKEYKYLFKSDLSKNDS